MNERRISRLQEQIKHRLAEVLQRDLADPKLGMVTITRVELDREFTNCKAFWSVIGDDLQKKRSAEVLRRARGLCQRAMGESLHTRTVPTLRFIFDTGIEEAFRVTNVIAELKRERELREGQSPPADPAGEPDTRPPTGTDPG